MVEKGSIKYRKPGPGTYYKNSIVSLLRKVQALTKRGNMWLEKIQHNQFTKGC